MRQNRHSLLAFLKLKGSVFLTIGGKITGGVILLLGEFDWLDWSYDKDDTLGLA